MALQCNFGTRAKEVVFVQQEAAELLGHLVNEGNRFKLELTNMQTLLAETVVAQGVIDAALKKDKSIIEAQKKVDNNIIMLSTIIDDQAAPERMNKAAQANKTGLFAPIRNAFSKVQTYIVNKIVTEEQKRVLDKAPRLMAFDKIALDAEKKELELELDRLRKNLDLLSKEARMLISLSMTEALAKRKVAWVQKMQATVQEVDVWLKELTDWADAADKHLKAQVNALSAHQEEANKLCELVQTRVPPTPPPPPVVEREPFVQTDPDFMAKVNAFTADRELFPMYPMKLGEPGVGRCDRPTGDELQAADYQQAFGCFGHRLILANWLMYWAPGSGKTNAINFYIQRFVLSMLEKPAGSPVEEVCVFVHVDSEIEKYRNAYEHVRYRLPEFEKITSQPEPNKSSRDSRHVCTVFLHPDDPDRVIAKLRVSFMGIGFTIGEPDVWDNVTRVLVDEAHYLFAPNEAGFSKKSFTLLKELYERPDIKKVFCTGTPTSDDDHPIRTIRMLAFLSMDFLSHDAFHLTKDQLVTGWVDTQSAIDAAGGRDKFNAIPVKIMSKYFVPETKPPKWMPGKQELIANIASKLVSYVTLENDPGVYPRKSGPRDMTGLFASLKNGGVITFSKGKFEGPVVANTSNIVKVNVVTDRPTSSKSKNQLSKSFRQNQNDPVPVKFHAVAALLELNPGKKCFMFTPTKRYDLDIFEPLQKFLHSKGFTRFTVMQYQLRRITSGDKNYESNAAESRIRDMWQRSRSEFVDHFYKDLTKGKRYIALNDTERKWSKDTELFKMMLEVANDVRNLHGEYICLTFGSRSAREGLNIMDTPMVIFSEPTSSGSEYRQAVARAMRFCSFALTNPTDITNWLVSAFVLVSVDPKGKSMYDEGPRLALMDIPNESAVIEQTMQEYAFDCTKNSRLKLTCAQAPASGDMKVAEPEEIVTCYPALPAEAPIRVPMKDCTGLVNLRRYNAFDEVLVMTMGLFGNSSQPVMMTEPVKAAIQAVLASAKPPEVVYNEVLRPLNEEQLVAVWQQFMSRRSELDRDEQTFVQDQARDYMNAQKAYEKAVELGRQFKPLVLNSDFAKVKETLAAKVAELDKDLRDMRVTYMEVPLL